MVSKKNAPSTRIFVSYKLYNKNENVHGYKNQTSKIDYWNRFTIQGKEKVAFCCQEF